MQNITIAIHRALPQTTAEPTEAIYLRPRSRVNPKTAIAKTLSKCLDFPFEQISFGGVSDPEFLTGHDYTYIGSRPGEIVRCLSRMGYKNGIIFLDEFEKTSGKKGISSTLLHLTDFTQNHEFRDNYLADITIDLSNTKRIIGNRLPVVIGYALNPIFPFQVCINLPVIANSSLFRWKTDA